MHATGGPSGNGGGPDKPSDDNAKVKKVLAELKITGLSKAKARELLKTWAEAGVKDEESLKQMLTATGSQKIFARVIQLLIDTAACLGGFYISYLGSQGEGGLVLLELLGNFLGLYYFIQVMLELSIASATVYSTLKYRSATPELFGAVQEIAGSNTGLSIVDKASAAVNVFKVASYLNEISLELKTMFNVEGGAAAKTPSTKETLSALSALLTLQKAKDELGFEPAKFGLSEKQAINIALAFATFDTNDNGKLDKSELNALCARLGKSFEGAELDEAMKKLDIDADGMINFLDFVGFWCISGCTVDDWNVMP
jgi:hypothetical protein